MVDVSAKPATAREAVARGRIRIAPATMRVVRAGRLKKGGAYSWWDAGLSYRPR